MHTLQFQRAHLILLAIVLAPAVAAQDPEARVQPGSQTTPPDDRVGESCREAASFRTRLRELLDRKEAADRLEINGRIFELTDLERLARPIAGHRESAALAEVVVMQFLRERLIAGGHYLDEAAADKAYRAHLAADMFNSATFATRFHGYPSAESYRRWCRLRASFHRSIEQEITLEVLAAHVRRESVLLSPEQRVVDSMFFAARKDGRWDFAGALQRARRAHVALVKGEQFHAVAKSGDPMPEDPWRRKRTESHGFVGHRYLCGESEHSDWVAGVSAVRGFFYATAKPGDLSEPLLGPEGYWIVRFGAHKPWQHRNFTLEVDDREQLARRLYVDYRFREWIRGVLVKVVIKESGHRKK